MRDVESKFGFYFFVIKKTGELKRFGSFSKDYFSEKNGKIFHKIFGEMTPVSDEKIIREKFEIEEEKHEEHKEIIDENMKECECGNMYDSEKYSCCYQCFLKKHAKRYGVSATKRKFF